MTQTAPESSAVTTSGDGRFASLDPRTGEVVAHHPIHSPKQVADAVAQARRASNWWQELGFDGRKERLDAWRRLLVKRVDEAASLISAETGKPAADAKLELVLVIDHLHWAAKNADRVLRKRRVPAGLLMSNQAATVEYLPLGVVGVIGPWNYPAFTPMGSIAYALAAGNTVVFKPSELTPGVGTWLADTLAEVVPEHPVLSVVTGFGETGAALCRSGVDKLAFTGSTETGKRVMAACAESLTPVLVECGGKDALIVDYDADVQLAADAAVWGGMSNAGQTCVGVERVYVHEDVADEFTAAVKKLAGKVRPGGDPGADLGPITMPAQVDIIRSHVQDALDKGARALVGGVESVRPPFVEPVVLVDVPEDSLAITDETFGPTITINRVRDTDEAIRLANAGRYGLGGTVFSKSRGEQLARRLKAGMVSINGVVAFAAIPSLPFGGVGDSGFGRIHGEDGLREFARPQAVARRKFRPLLNPMSFTRGAGTVRQLLAIVKLRYGRK
ncbi:aldehyde dehydrogenase family protein [Kutzneria sp. 744]|uniref:aldehyde dehydrogenase family protein n=1 Tax=Kutzneria sp. (strain 744) TaxID=345341 RepID=UPI0003EED24B|nr:aldehyde dehydrogenase family protein [Kutzneria sp. 744]EWM16130.1 aldehyde dehydrogenase (NAD+) [Kutzneria sp. 744]